MTSCVKCTFLFIIQIKPECFTAKGVEGDNTVEHWEGQGFPWIRCSKVSWKWFFGPKRGKMENKIAMS